MGIPQTLNALFELLLDFSPASASPITTFRIENKGME